MLTEGVTYGEGRQLSRGGVTTEIVLSETRTVRESHRSQERKHEDPFGISDAPGGEDSS